MTKRQSQQVLETRLSKVYVYQRMRYERMRQCKWVEYRLPLHDTIGSASDPESRGMPSVWQRLAGFCAQHCVDPVRYIQWRLSSSILVLERPPEPKELLSGRWAKEFLKDAPNRVAEIALRRGSEVSLARTEISYLQYSGRMDGKLSLIAVLNDEGLELSPLFRYCLAYDQEGHQFERIARRYEDGAAVQYQHNPDAYRETWDELIPAAFGERSRQIYDRVIGLESRNAAGRLRDAR